MCIFKTPYMIEKSILIDASKETVWENITNFSKKAEWSPWYRLEKTAIESKTGDFLAE